MARYELLKWHVDCCVARDKQKEKPRRRSNRGAIIFSGTNEGGFIHPSPAGTSPTMCRVVATRLPCSI